MAGTLRNALFVSLIWHILCGGVIDPTFGEILGNAHFPEVLFLGSILDSRDLVSHSQEKREDRHSKDSLYSYINLFNFKTSVLSKEKGESFSSLIKYKRPLFNLSYQPEEKIITRARLDHSILDEYKKDSSLVFYPRLPYSFLIYFKDRQKAHIEFSFFISKEGVITFIDRKITSGNLEVDLLASRYINRHLNLIKGQFLTDTWQTVKIDLTRRDDQN